jgi:hypothetical protein
MLQSIFIISTDCSRVSIGVKQYGCDADHSPLSNAKIKKCGTIPPLPSMFSWDSAELFNHNGSLTVYSLIRFITDSRNVDSCQYLFKELHILPLQSLQSQCIFSLLIMIVKNRDCY